MCHQKFDTWFLIAFIFFNFFLSLELSAEPAGKAIFEKRCKQCHALPDPNTPPEMGWVERLKIMAKAAKLSPDEKSDVLSYLQSHTQKAEQTISLADERRVFEQKCSLCHTLDRILIEPLTDETRQHIVKRMREKNATWISEDESRQILDYLSKAPKVEREKKAKGDAKRVFLERCSACHTLERVFNKMQDGETPPWVHIVQRMQSKAPQWLSKEDAELVIEYLKSLK